MQFSPTAWITCEKFHVLPREFEIIIFCNCCNQKHITLFFIIVHMANKTKTVEAFHECYSVHFYCITICLYKHFCSVKLFACLHRKASKVVFSQRLLVMEGDSGNKKLCCLRRVSILHASLFVYIIKWLSFLVQRVTTLSAINRIYHVQYLRSGGIDAYQTGNKTFQFTKKKIHNNWRARSHF